jgi:ATP-dependent DNA helicase RecG
MAFREFRRRALASARLTEEDLNISDEMLMKNLMLTDGKYLKRAALLLFHENPEQWVMGAYVKIGFFENPAEILFQDEVHGSLISMPDKVVDLVYHKYFKAIISYDGLHRVETYPIPCPAFREAVINAVTHRYYGTGNPIHIHIYPDKVLIYNDARLPENLTKENLFKPHTSVPSNPMIASAFFLSGLIEAWGHGIEKITTACKNARKPEPFYQIRSNEVMIGFNIEPHPGEKFGVTQLQRLILDLIRDNPNISAKTLAQVIGITPRNVENNISDMKKAGFLYREGAAKGGSWKIVATY